MHGTHPIILQKEFLSKSSWRNLLRFALRRHQWFNPLSPVNFCLILGHALSPSPAPKLKKAEWMHHGLCLVNPQVLPFPPLRLELRNNLCNLLWQQVLQALLLHLLQAIPGHQLERSQMPLGMDVHSCPTSGGISVASTPPMQRPPVLLDLLLSQALHQYTPALRWTISLSSAISSSTTRYAQFRGKNLSG